jgi:hypothetical protein
MDDPHAQPVHELTNDLDLEILDLLCKEAHSAQRLTETLSQGDEQVGVDAVRGHLEGLASHGLARPSEEAAHHADEAEADELVIAEEADQLWEITEEGRAVVVEPHSRVARAPYDLDVGNDKGDDDDRDVAGLVVLLLIALVTGACAAYTLLSATGVLGGG